LPDFFKETLELKRKVGKGHLTGTFAVDGGARSVPLELGFWRSGPNDGARMENWTTEGTGPHAAQKSLQDTHEISLEDIAKTLLAEGPQEGMKRHVERVDAKFKELAPRVTGQYADSTARVVEDDGVPIHEEYGAYWEQDPSGSGASE